MKVTKKRKGFEFKMSSLNGSKGNYLFLKDLRGSYHAFLEVATKEAIKDCGATGNGNTRQLCRNRLGF